MRAIQVLVAAVLGASAGAILFVFLWAFFLGWQQVGLPRAVLPWGILVGAVIGGLFGAGGTWYSLVVYQRRLDANREYATRLKLQFEEKPADLDWPLSMCRHVRSGEPGTWQFHWQGAYGGLPLDVVDVSYTVRSSNADGPDSSRTYEHTVYAWNVEPFQFPCVSISGRSWGAAIATALLGNYRIVGFDAANLPVQRAQVVREFNRHFLVVASPHPEGDEPVRKLCVPDVMQGLLSLGRVSLFADQGRIAIWWPHAVSSGAARQQQIEQTHRLIKTLLSASEDTSAELVPADPHVRTEAVWSLLPLGCALGLGIPGFFAGGISLAIIGFSMREHGELPQFLFPVLPFGGLLLFGTLGWVLGYALNRLRSG